MKKREQGEHVVVKARVIAHDRDAYLVEDYQGHMHWIGEKAVHDPDPEGELVARILRRFVPEGYEKMSHRDVVRHVYRGFMADQDVPLIDPNE